jgi:hypothetical protein
MHKLEELLHFILQYGNKCEQIADPPAPATSPITPHFSLSALISPANSGFSSAFERDAKAAVVVVGRGLDAVGANCDIETQKQPFPAQLRGIELIHLDEWKNAVRCGGERK